MTRHQGDAGEAMAAEYLERQGYEIVQRNCVVQVEGFRAEIDIVARDPQAQQVVFVEVKFRATEADGAGVGAITPTKLRRMRRAAGVWLSLHRPAERCSPRVDVVDVGPWGIREHLKDVW
ncbi:YraN family protein [Corynebacterium sp. 320]|uniref:YraN family protein n=1 Tax=Corynebacterium TaxID=1716 RepID=UPI00125CBAB9|nr:MULTISPECIES: YraN family protein [Corynebacterium]KAB1503822.1 YraN family protein [Corynebacterium sp. 320]KAB1553079.1 YraN family protein [Corynebacterium sp. 321]KAB1553703.1 YraN family protein [Corynebacterium sp. 319]KAB3527958.1 YraN family protein [Corynebacterium sp. 250]KAB3540554.1 YraN family protein [Corynebacterium sp. 366]